MDFLTGTQAVFIVWSFMVFFAGLGIGIAIGMEKDFE
jgi:hypothetical protein